MDQQGREVVHLPVRRLPGGRVEEVSLLGRAWGRRRGRLQIRNLDQRDRLVMRCACQAVLPLILSSFAPGAKILTVQVLTTRAPPLRLPRIQSVKKCKKLSD